MTDNTKLSIRVNPADLHALKRAALDRHMTLTEMVLKALDEYIGFPVSWNIMTVEGATTANKQVDNIVAAIKLALLEAGERDMMALREMLDCATTLQDLFGVWGEQSEGDVRG